MEIAPTPPQQPVDAEAIAGQQAHWASTFDATEGELPRRLARVTMRVPQR
jgi:hypothetical protein